MRDFVEIIIEFVGISARVNLLVLLKTYQNIINDPFISYFPERSDLFDIVSIAHYQWCSSKQECTFEYYLYSKTCYYRKVKRERVEISERENLIDFADFHQDLYDFEAVYFTEQDNRYFEPLEKNQPEPPPEILLETTLQHIKTSNKKSKLDNLFLEFASEKSE